MRSITFSLLVFAAGCLTQTAFASDFVGKRGGWEVYRSEDGCSMGMEFEGPGDTELTLLKFTDATFGLLITNSNWSSKEGAEYDIRYVLNGMEFSGGKARGISVSYRKGFAGFFPSSFERHLAAGDSLHIYMGEQRIDQLSLSGTTVALALVNQCLNGVRAIKAAEAREKARWEHLPKDPFAGGAGIVPNQSVVPIGSAASWATINDYPSRALREGREGVTSVRVIIGSDGRVTDCQITSSSGHADLDQATCDNVRRRSRFSPATDSDGKPTSGTFDQVQQWVIPKD